MWYHTLTKTRHFSYLTVIFACLTGCGGQSESQNQLPIQHVEPTSITVVGSAAKGALINASIKVYALDEGGNISDPTPVFETTTNELGEFTLAIPVSNQPRLIKSFGGSYIDEADQEPDISLKRKITFTAEQGLSSVLLPNQTSVAITIASTALIAKTKIESTSNNFFETLRLNQTNAANAFGFNIIDTVPADTLSPSTTATVTQMQYALVLGGLANLANRFALELGFSEPNFSIIEAIIHDFSDGIVDGQYQGVPLEYLNKYGEQQALPQDISLNEQINRFQNNNSNNFSQTPSITINEQLLQQPQITNYPPVVSVNQVLEVEGLKSATIVATVSDQDGTVDAINWSQTSGPTLLFADNNSEQLTITAPDVLTNSKATLRVSVVDDKGAISSESIEVSIIARNRAPSISLPDSFEITEQTSTTITATITDNDGTISNIQWQQTAGPNVELQGVDSATIRFTSPIVTTNTPMSFDVTATDDDGDSTTQSITITVTPLNIPPNVSAGSPQVIFSEQSTTLTGESSDSDGSIVSTIWQQTSGPAAAIISPSSLSTQIIAPTVTAISDLTFNLQVTDNEGASSSADVSIIVKPIIPPNVFAGEDQVVESNASVSLQGVASDADGQIVSVSWIQTGGVSVSLSATDSLATSFIAPIVTANQLLTFNLTVTDDIGATAVDSVNITVEPPNLEPQVSAGSDQVIHSGLSVTLSGDATDQDGTIAAVQWTQNTGPTVVLSSPTETTTSFTAPIVSANQQLSFTLTATDDDGASKSANVSVTVEPPNKAPSIILDSFQSVNANQSASLSATVTDTDGKISSYLWRQTSGTSVSLSGETTPNASFTAPNVSQDTSLTFELSATDDDGLTSTASTTVNVVAQNTPPTVNAGPDQAIHGGRVISLVGSATDDGAISSYEWSQLSGNISVTFSSPTSAITTINSASVESNEVIVLQLKATDNLGLIGTDTVSITILPPNLNPIANAGFDTTAIGNQIITLSGTASDTDGTIASTVWTQAAGTSATISNINALSTQVTIPSNSSGEVLTFKLRVTDDDGATADSSVDVIVYSPILAWQFNATQAIHSSPAIDNNGNIIFGNDGSQIYSIAPAGTTNWTYTAGGAIKGSVMLDDTDNIYVGSGDGSVYKLSSAGEKVWSFATSDPVNNPVTLVNSNEVYVSSGSNTYVILTDESGTPDQLGDLSYSNTLSAGITALPGVVDANAQLLYPASDPVINKIELSSTPIVTSTFMTPSATIFSGLSLLDEGSAGYFIDSTGVVTYFEDSDGLITQTMQIPLSDTSSAPIVIGFDNDIYFGTQNGYFYNYTLNNAGNSSNWQSNLGSAITSSALLLSDGEVVNSVIVGAEDGYVYSLNAQSGNVQWKFKTGAAIKSAPVFYNNTLYITSTDGQLYAISLTGHSLATSPWPMYRRDPKHQANINIGVQAGMN
ncbi:PKD domain-containing protein [Pseudoalteromonas ulvae]|uniref:PKD/Chitinase domain-containing protein n=1 Tax=Pseudoalteromonas ulvae TaxID=107327 RepID=A0A244CU49_PSEDV|nr:PQQ-binding-like beta-propeller repeat protein [Pseudoalteromonas ulvae]OUL58759.1 hypothetical protein B1199_00265 [Pseudoalteromonas ulvae]